MSEHAHLYYRETAFKRHIPERYTIVMWSPYRVLTYTRTHKKPALELVAELQAKHPDGEYRRILCYGGKSVHAYQEWNHHKTGWASMIAAVNRKGRMRIKPGVSFSKY